MKAAIYNPYLDTLGGGERYSMAFAQSLVKKGYRVDVQWKDSQIRQRLEQRFGVNLKQINFITNIKRGDNYDICFWVSDGSIPLLRARNNILHFQIPFRNIKGKSLITQMKLFRINHVVCNSFFTKKIIDREYSVVSKVIYPPVDSKKIRPKKKENLIVSVGRFSQLIQQKRQDVLIKAFKKLNDTGLNNWEMVLAGGVEVGVDKYLTRLKSAAKGYPIKIVESPSFKEVIELYAKAKIFWSASGYGIDEDKDPKKVEHFGITVVEAMSAQAIPIVFNAGGHKEIVEDKVNGYLWKDIKQLVVKSKKVAEDSKSLRKMSLNARKGVEKFSYERFEKEVSQLI